MITGRTVTVRTPVLGAADPFNAAGITYTDTDVENVLLTPGPCDDYDQSNRPDGVKVSLTAHFPKTYTADLEYCHVVVEGKEFAVVGKPQRYMAENTPTPWNCPAELEAIDG